MKQARLVYLQSRPRQLFAMEWLEFATVFVDPVVGFQCLILDGQQRISDSNWRKLSLLVEK